MVFINTDFALKGIRVEMMRQDSVGQFESKKQHSLYWNQV